jgi:ABC-type amino acid transport substrate-binding protein
MFNVSAIHRGCITLLAAWCCAAAGGNAVAGGAIVLRVAAQEGTEPKFIPGPQGSVVGLCIDIMRSIERIDPELRFEGHQNWMPLVRVYHEAAIGQQDAVCGIQRLPERDPLYHFLDQELFSVNYMLVARSDDSAIISNWDDVRKLGPKAVLLSNRGFAATRYLEQLGGLQIDSSASSTTVNLQKLLAGRGRFLVHRTPGLQAILERNGVAGKVRILPTVMGRAPLYMALSRQLDPAVGERIRNALEQMTRNGELEQLLRKWAQ